MILSSFNARFFVDDGGVLSIGEGSKVRAGVAEGLVDICIAMLCFECCIRECDDTARPG